MTVADMFYQAVVATVLLYGSESWVLPPSALKVLEGFHVEAGRRMTGMRPQQRTAGPWIYPQSVDVLGWKGTPSKRSSSLCVQVEHGLRFLGASKKTQGNR